MLNEDKDRIVSVSRGRIDTSNYNISTLLSPCGKWVLATYFCTRGDGLQAQKISIDEYKESWVNA